jgi:hypothetical protein
MYADSFSVGSFPAILKVISAPSSPQSSHHSRAVTLPIDYLTYFRVAHVYRFGDVSQSVSSAVRVADQFVA